MKLYLLNALITPFDTAESENAFFAVKKISKEMYEQILENAIKSKYEVESVLGHESTVEFMKMVMSDDLKKYFVYNRTEINLEEGDLALVMRVNVRGKNFKEHTVEDLEKFYEEGKIEFLTLSRIYHPELVFNPFMQKEENNV